MIALAKSTPKPFEAILVWKYSRFARNREDSVVYKSMLRKQCGIDVVSISEATGDDKMSILFEAMIEAMDEYYSINLSEEVKRGMTEKAFEEVLFSLDEGEVSDLVETADGFYIVKCISTMDYDATQENKLILAEQRKKEAFSKAYAEVAENTHSQFRDKQWNALNLNEEIHVTDANFFDIYHEFMN